jgi:hypothetical protein
MTLSEDSVWPGVGTSRDASSVIRMTPFRCPNAGALEVEEWSMSASNSRYLTCHTGDDFDWRFHVGLIGHDNIPRSGTRKNNAGGLL